MNENGLNCMTDASRSPDCGLYAGTCKAREGCPAFVPTDADADAALRLCWPMVWMGRGA